MKRVDDLCDAEKLLAALALLEEERDDWKSRALEAEEKVERLWQEAFDDRYSEVMQQDDDDRTELNDRLAERHAELGGW